MLSNVEKLNFSYEEVEPSYGGKVYGIKRNFKKKFQSKMPACAQRNNVSTFYNSYVGASTNNTATPVPPNINLGDYKFPSCNKVKCDCYFSRIDFVNDLAATKSGEPATEVFYTIIDQQICYKIAAGDIKGKATDKALHIRQLYPKGKQRYQALIDSVTESIGHPITKVSDFYGVTEWVKLEYGDYNIGGFTERSPISWQEVKNFFVNSIMERNKIMNSYIDDETPEIDDESNCSSTYDDTQNTNNTENHDDYDEFDDFLPDDDYWDQ